MNNMDNVSNSHFDSHICSLFASFMQVTPQIFMTEMSNFTHVPLCTNNLGNRSCIHYLAVTFVLLFHIYANKC